MTTAEGGISMHNHANRKKGKVTIAIIASLLSIGAVIQLQDDVTGTMKEAVFTLSDDQIPEGAFYDPEVLEALKVTSEHTVGSGICHGKRNLSLEEMASNAKSLLAYAKSDKPTAYDDAYPTLDVIKDLLSDMKNSNVECSRKSYQAAMASLMAKEGNQVGLPRYILHHIDDAMTCRQGGIIVAKRTASGTKYVFDGLRDGFHIQLSSFFEKWGVTEHEFEKRYQEVLKLDPRPEGCHGCVAFLRTSNGLHGPRWFTEDKQCDEVIEVDSTGYCECEGHVFTPLLNGHIETTCNAACGHADYEALGKKPHKVSVRVTTGGVDDADSKMSPKISFGDQPEILHTMSHLPVHNEEAIYEFHLEKLPSLSLTLHADGEHSGNAWQFNSADMSVGNNAKFQTLGPVHSWLLSKPYGDKNNYAGDSYGEELTLTPFSTTVTIEFGLGDLNHATPPAALAPDFFVMGLKSHDRWYAGGQLDLNLPTIKGVRTQSHTIRKDIGDIHKIKFVPKDEAGADIFMTSVKILTSTDHPEHQHEQQVMHPTHLWLSPGNHTESSTYYSFTDTIPWIIMTPKTAPHKWDGHTCGGTAPRNSKCKFPFMHNGISHNTCTTAGRSKQESWCETEEPGTWAYCDCERYTTWKGTAGAGAKCELPFKKNGVWHDDCISEHEFGEHTYPCDEGMCKGDMPNGVCSVDALYQGRWAGCQPLGGHPTIAKYERVTNGQGPSAAGVKCALPFFYKGRWVENCVGDAYGGYGWCATSTLYKDQSRQWGGCRPALKISDRYIRWPDDVTKYVGENSHPDDKCKFPFEHSGGLSYDCINRGMTDDGTPHGWCSLDTKFKGRWGACAYTGYKPNKPMPGDRWTDGKAGTVEIYTACHFPFYYQNKKYTTCVGQSDIKKYGWCSTSEVFSNKWGNCLAPGERPPAQDCVLTEWSDWTRGDVSNGGSCKKASSLVGLSKGNASDVGQENASNEICAGETVRVRSVLIPMRHGGKPCSNLPALRKQSRQCKAAKGCSKVLMGAVSNSLTGKPIMGATITATCGSDATAQASDAGATNITVDSSDADADAEDYMDMAMDMDISLLTLSSDRHEDSVTATDDGFWTKSEVDGMYSIGGLRDGPCQVEFKAENFITMMTTVSLPDLQSKVVKNLSLRPIPVDIPDSGDASGPISLTLNWESFPSDMDAHMIFAPLEKGDADVVDITHASSFGASFTSETQKAVHFFWMDQGDKDKSPYVTLDNDELSGRGPETVTIHKFEEGHYHYYVKCFSCAPTSDEPDTDMPKSGATVSVTQGVHQMRLPLVGGTETVQQYEIAQTNQATGKASRIWDVITFTVKDNKVTITPHLKYRGDEPSFNANAFTSSLAEPLTK